MTESQKLKIGVVLVVVQLCLLALTLGFKTGMDCQAEKAGIAGIIEEGSR